MRGSTSNQKQIRQAHLPEACQRPGCPSQAASVVPLLSTKATARSAERRRQPSCPPSRDAMTTGDERHRQSCERRRSWDERTQEQWLQGVDFYSPPTIRSRSHGKIGAKHFAPAGFVQSGHVCFHCFSVGMRWVYEP
jgi:hypothetical protein